MLPINGLMESLNRTMCWNKSRLDCFARMLLAMMAVRTVNLQEIALGFSSPAQVSSRYRRLQKFFAHFEIDFVVIARWLFSLFFADKASYYLVMDRTNWYWGRRKVNIFMLSIVYEGQAIPLFWQLLDKAGSTNIHEQRRLLHQFIKVFGKSGIAGLLADREFASGQLFAWLNQQHIPFYIRIKEGSVICIKEKKWWKAKKLFNDVNPNTHKPFQMTVNVFGQKVFLAGSRSEGGELMIVATNQTPQTAIAKYLRRWEIECLFQSLKGRGFRFEETHLTDQRRIAKLVALLATGFAWAHKTGEWRALKKPITIKNFSRSKRPQYSYFRYGLDFIRAALLQLTCLTKPLMQCIELLNLPFLKTTS